MEDTAIHPFRSAIRNMSASGFGNTGVSQFANGDVLSEPRDGGEGMSSQRKDGSAFRGSIEGIRNC